MLLTARMWSWLAVAAAFAAASTAAAEVGGGIEWAGKRDIIPVVVAAALLGLAAQWLGWIPQ